MWAVFAVCFLAYAGLLSRAARRDARFLQSKLVQALAVAGFFGLLYPVAQEIGPLLIMPLALAGAALGIPFVSYLIGDLVEDAIRVALGTASMRLRRSCDAAERAEREGRPDDALRLWREAAARDPSDPEPLRRIGELLLSRGERPGALEAFRAALPLLAEPEPHATLAFRIADLEEREEARRLLEEVARRFPGTRFAACACERLGTL